MSSALRTSQLVTPVAGGAEYLNGTSSQLVKTGEGELWGIFIPSTTAGTIKLWDNTAAEGTVLIDTFSVAAATWYALPFRFKTGLFITVANTIVYTISFT